MKKETSNGIISNNKKKYNAEEKNTQDRVASLSNTPYLKAEEVAFKNIIEKKETKIPKFGTSDYDHENVQTRLDWLEKRTGTKTKFLKTGKVPTEIWKGNIENLIGFCQVPIGVAGPLTIQGEHAQGNFYIPMATTEGAIITTYNVGMRLLSESNGVTTMVKNHGAHISPMFYIDSFADGKNFVSWIKQNFQSIKKVAETTTQHGKLISIEERFFDRRVILQFNYTTGDAQGLNMINVATEKACLYIKEKTHKNFHVRSNFSGVKKVSMHNVYPNFGKEVHAEAFVSNKTLKKLRTSGKEVAVAWHDGLAINTKSNILGINCQAANGIAGIFLACGQDIADISSSHIAYSDFKATEDGLHIQVYIPSLCIGTIGGGTGKGTQKECLELLGCYGTGKVLKFSEIIAATVLAGELATVCAVVTDTFVQAHATLGRNKPIL